MTLDRFDLEDKIMQSSLISDDLKALASYIADQDEIDKDYIMNALMGLHCLQEARFHNLWQAYVATFQLNDFSYPDDDEDDLEEYRTSNK